MYCCTLSSSLPSRHSLDVTVLVVCRMSATTAINAVPMKKRARRLNSILDIASADFIKEVSSVELPEVGEVQVKVVKGDFSAVPAHCQQFIAKYVRMC